LRRKKKKVEYDSRILGGGDFVGEILKEADRAEGKSSCNY